MKSRKKNKKNRKGDGGGGGGGDDKEGDSEHRAAAPPNDTSLTLSSGSTDTQRAEEEFARGDWNAAINSYTRAIALANQKPQVLAQLTLARAKARWFAKDFTQALADACSAISLQPTFGVAHVWRAHSHLRLDQYQDAIEHYNAALRLLGDNHPMATGIKEVMTHAMAVKGQPKDTTKKHFDVEWYRSKGLLASEETKAVVEDLPLLNPVGEYTLLDFNAAELADATKKAERAVREKELGNQDFAQGMYISALVHYSNAIKIQPREPVFYSNRALVYLKLNRFAEAITDCTASIDRKPSIKAFARRAAAWASLNQHVLAAEDYKRALKFEARNQDCLQELQKCLAAIEEDCKKLLVSEPQHEPAKRLLKRVRDDYKKYILQPAVSDVAPASGSSSSSSTTTPSSAVPSSAPTTTNAPVPSAAPAASTTASPAKNVHAERELLDEIIEFSKRLEADATDSQAFLGRARLYLKRSDLDKAINDFKMGLRIDPDNKDLQQGLRQAISIKTKDLQDKQAAQAAAQQAQALAQPTTVAGQQALMFETEPATDAIPADAPSSATCPAMLVAAGPLPERSETSRTANVTNGNVINSSTLGPSSVAALHAAAAAAVPAPPAEVRELSDDSEFDEGDDEGDYDVESEPDSDDSSPRKPTPPGHKQP